MTPASLQHLNKLYASTDDPWCHRTSPYEQRKYELAISALGESRYEHILELGCGNGEFARRLSCLSESYTGFDAVDRALLEAKKAVPHGEFFQGFYPCKLPAGDYDLIVVSEFLYFLDKTTIKHLADTILKRWRMSDILVVNYRGETGHVLDGDGAGEIFRHEMIGAYRPTRWISHEEFNLEILKPVLA